MDSFLICKNAVAWVKQRSYVILSSVSNKSVDDATSSYLASLKNMIPLQNTKKSSAQSIKTKSNDVHRSSKRRKLRSHGI